MTGQGGAVGSEVVTFEVEVDAVAVEDQATQLSDRLASAEEMTAELVGLGQEQVLDLLAEIGDLNRRIGALHRAAARAAVALPKDARPPLESMADALGITRMTLHNITKR